MVRIETLGRPFLTKLVESSLPASVEKVFTTSIISMEVTLHILVLYKFFIMDVHAICTGNVLQTVPTITAELLSTPSTINRHVTCKYVLHMIIYI